MGSSYPTHDVPAVVAATVGGGRSDRVDAGRCSGAWRRPPSMARSPWALRMKWAVPVRKTACVLQKNVAGFSFFFLLRSLRRFPCLGTKVIGWSGGLLSRARPKHGTKRRMKFILLLEGFGKLLFGYLWSGFPPIYPELNPF